ncbi:hypothetical protein [Nitrobacter winogradskyi]|uniref:hypothetical protein n=1 Tax=Nitrobacter winogradskyi TaxID=913 RepID=UPI0009D752B4|nr:hypothetical protein [Nitrobacter winogradskyi]
MNITRIEPVSDDSPRTPTLLALFDVELPQATLRGCKLLESGAGECFILPPPGLKFWDDAPLRHEICEAALDALDEIET